MIIRQMKKNQYHDLYLALRKHAYSGPAEASYTVRMTVNGSEYAVKVQPEEHCRMVVLQAHRIDREGEAPHFELITKGSLPASFLEILIHQGVPQSCP